MHFLSIYSGSNVKFDDDDIINRLNCFCHILNNIVCHMCSIEPIKKLVDDVSSLVSYIRSSGLGANCDPQLKKYAPTRFNTICDTFHTVEVNYSKIAQILLTREEADKNANLMNRLTVISRHDLEVISDFLKKFKEWTKLLEVEKKPNLWMVWPIVVQLKKYLIEQPEDAEIVKAMKLEGRKYIEKNLNDIDPKMIHKINTVLHPLLKNIAIASYEEKNDVYAAINQKIMSTQSNETTNVECLAEVANQDILEEFMGASSLDSSQSSVQSVQEEFNRYLSAQIGPTNPYEFDLVGWWLINRHTFPNLFHLFLSLAGITASSSPSERSFSETGIIITARRSSLLPETVSDLVLARNIFLNFL